MSITRAQERKIRIKAKEAYEYSYSPYSQFSVGAAVIGGSGKVYSGTNVENSSFGLTMCAERVAIFSAISAGEEEILSLCIYTPTDKPTRPCGSCLQVLSEFVGPYHQIEDEFTIGTCLDVYLIGICKTKKEYSGFLSEMYNDKFTSERFKL